VRINPIPPQRNHVTDSTYIAANGFAGVLEEAIRELDKIDSKEKSRRIVERKGSTDSFDMLV
jgi:hypothetical protein